MYRALLLIFACNFTISAAALAVDSCYAKFRDPMDKVIGWTAADCKALQGDEPSVCQRSIGDRCQKSYGEEKRIRADICGALASDQTFLQSRQYAGGVDSQKAGLDATGALASDTATVSDAMGAQLQSESGKVSALMRDNDSALHADVCAKSAAYPAYSNRMKILSENLTVVRGLLDAFSHKKKGDALKANSIVTTVDARSQALSSATPMLAGDTFDSGGNQTKKWILPALGVGAAGLGLYALLKMKDKGTSPPPVDLDSSGGTPPSGSGPAQEPPSEPGAPIAPAPPGNPGTFLTENGVRVDPSFTDADRAQIAQAINLYPECQRKYLVGVAVRNDPHLSWQSGRSAGKCLPGKNISMSPPTIALNTRCGTGMNSYTALLVHELMHVLANRRGLYGRYNAVFSQHKGCGVSPYSHQFYGGNNINEDFAEAGRIAIFPRSGNAYSGSCIEPKLKAAKDIIYSCQ